MRRRDFLGGVALGAAALATPFVGRVAGPKVTRYAEVLKHNLRVRTRFQDLEHGDVFQLFEQDGTPVDDDITVALSDAYLHDFGNGTGEQWTINCHEWCDLAYQHLKPNGPRHSWLATNTNQDGHWILLAHPDVEVNGHGLEALGGVRLFRTDKPTSIYFGGNRQWDIVWQNGLAVVQYVDPGVYI